MGDNSHLGANAQLSGGTSVGPNTIAGDNLTLGMNATIGSNVRGDNNITLGAGSVVRSQAAIGGNLTMGVNSEIASGGVVGSNCAIGDGVEMRGELRNAVTLEDNTFVGNQSSVGDNSALRLNATVGQFVILGSGNDIGEDCAVFSGSELGNDCTVGARTQILYRTSIGNEATIGTDNLIDEQIDIGNHFTLGNNSRLWPFSSFSDRVSVGDDVLIRNNALISDDVVIEDGVLLYPRTTIEEETVIRADVEIGVDDCRANGCGNVSIGACQDVDGNLGAFANVEGACVDGLDPSRAGTTCLDLLNAGVNADGVYWIDPDGDGGEAAFEVYCDMTTDGGGWTKMWIRGDGNRGTGVQFNEQNQTPDCGGWVNGPNAEYNLVNACRQVIELPYFDDNGNSVPAAQLTALTGLTTTTVYGGGVWFSDPDGCLQNQFVNDYPAQVTGNCGGSTLFLYPSQGDPANDATHVLGPQASNSATGSIGSGRWTISSNGFTTHMGVNEDSNLNNGNQASWNSPSCSGGNQITCFRNAFFWTR